jgi:hypothetical protein
VKMVAVSDDLALGATCDEGGEAPCFAHLLDDEAGEEVDEVDEQQDAALRTPAGRPSGPRPG